MKQTKADFSDSPPWFELALQFLGTKELLEDGTLNPTVRGFFKHTSYDPELISKRTPWCSAFVSSMLEQAGIRSTRRANARSYVKWGHEAQLILGAIVILARGDNPASGHVGFYAGTAGDRILVLSGNQKNSVCIALYPRARLLAVRWPDNR